MMKTDSDAALAKTADNPMINTVLRPLLILRRLFRTNFLFAVGLIICLTWITVAIFANSIAPQDPLAQHLDHRFEPPGSQFLFGTDNLGRDILSRVIIGSRLSLLAGVLTVIMASLIGVVYGGIAGYVGGVMDDIMMRFSEMVLSFPAIILAMTITAALGPSLFNTILAIIIVSWPGYARVMRSMVISIKENEYVQAAKVLGGSNFRILFREILPNSIGPVLVMATLGLGNSILTFSGLSFLGLGSPPPTPEWGSMVASGVENFIYWWIGTFPGLAIFTMSLGANFVGDGLRDFLDPKLRKEF